ncbi:carboxypeptidase-like regulatory domain-containing protein [Bacteroidota bacterium]
MIKYILLVLQMSFHFIAYNQTITGLVIDKKTKKELSSATIYFSGTSFGTSSDKNGNFKIDISQYNSNPLTISAIGYYSKTIENLYEIDNYLIKLAPKVYNINEAVVSSKSLVRQRKVNLRLFREEFLGTTDNSWDCEIVNEKDITFNYYEDEDTLKAYAVKPLIIKNRALGYNITYFLDEFEYYRDSKFVFFTGNFIFEEDSNVNKELTEQNRRYVYSGSRMHFFRSLWTNDLRSNHFRIINSENKKATYEDIVIEDDNNNKYLKYKGSLRVYYFEIESKMVISGLVSFEKNGNFDPAGIRWTGAMAGRRIADWLPLEYSVKDNNP